MGDIDINVNIMKNYNKMKSFKKRNEIITILKKRYNYINRRNLATKIANNLETNKSFKREQINTLETNKPLKREQINTLETNKSLKREQINTLETNKPLGPLQLNKLKTNSVLTSGNINIEGAVFI